MTLLSSISEMSDSGLLDWVTLCTRLGLNTMDKFSESILLEGSEATRRKCRRRNLHVMIRLLFNVLNVMS